MSRERLAVVVLNWNAAADTATCLAALRGELRDGDELVVVDNGSANDDLAHLRRACEQHGATLLRNDHNLGFAGGTNVGVRHALAAGADWILWWNNDALPRAGALETLRTTAQRLELDAAQPLLVDEGQPDRIDSAGLFAADGCGAFDWLRGEPATRAPADPTPILGPCGAAALYRASALRRAGLMDDELFVMCEDLDQALRVRKIGGQASLIPAAIATHRRGVSGDAPGGDLRRLRKLWLQRNAVALGLRDWPAAKLLRHLPTIAYRVAQALWLSRGSGHRCLPLWRAALRGRAAAQRQMRRFDVARFLAPTARSRS